MLPDRAMPVLPRTRSFHSPLVRCLEGLGVTAAPEGDRTVAEHLGDWLAWTDAIALFDVLQGSDGVTPAVAPRAAAALAKAATDDLDRVRSELTRSISADTTFAHGAVDATTARRGCHAQQHTMEERLGPVRAGLRTALAAQTPALGRLAALDALMERALASKERQLLSRLPMLLEETTPSGDDAPRAVPAVDGRALRTALLAELEMRMQPIEGLAEALAAAQAARLAPHRATRS